MARGLFGFITSQFAGGRKRTSSPIQLWDEYLTNWFNKDNSVDNIHPVRDYRLYEDFTGIYSGNRNITVVYSIDSFDSEMNIDFRDRLRYYCKQGVRVNFINIYEPYRIDWNNKETKNKFRVWSTLDNALQDENIDEYNYAQNMSKLDKTAVRKDSLIYVAQAIKKRRRKVLKTQQIMLVSGIRGTAFDISLAKIHEICGNEGINLTRITGNIGEYLNVYSPFSLGRNPDVTKKVGTNILTDEIISRFNTYSQGKVGNGSLYWGSDIENSFPILSEPKRNDTDAEIWLIIAETGGGKSFMVKGLIPQLLARKDMVGTINDIESEYIPIAYLVAASGTDSVEIIDLGSDQGNYFDATEIHLTGDPDLDSTMFEDSYNFTVAVFKALGLSYSAMQREDTNAEWSVQIIQEGVTNMYKKAGVDPTDMSTWENSKNLRYKSAYEEIKLVEKDNEQFNQAKDLLMAKLDSYFAPDGSHSGKFSEDHRITIDQIIDAKLVINTFGLKGKSSESIDPTQMALMQLYTTQIGHIRAVFAKARGMFNFKVFEEVQRWAKMSGSADILNATITGERKIGTITIVVSNKASELLDNDSLGVFENYTTIAIGAIADLKVREELVERISMPLMLPELNKIAKESKVSSEQTSMGMTQDEIEQNDYAKAFLVYLNRSEYAICKMRLPKTIRETELYKTGVKKDSDSI